DDARDAVVATGGAAGTGRPDDGSRPPGGRLEALRAALRLLRRWWPAVVVLIVAATAWTVLDARRDTARLDRLAGSRAFIAQIGPGSREVWRVAEPSARVAAVVGDTVVVESIGSPLLRVTARALDDGGKRWSRSYGGRRETAQCQWPTDA